MSIGWKLQATHRLSPAFHSATGALCSKRKLFQRTKFQLPNRNTVVWIDWWRPCDIWGILKWLEWLLHTQMLWCFLVGWGTWSPQMTMVKLVQFKLNCDPFISMLVYINQRLQSSTVWWCSPVYQQFWMLQSDSSTAQSLLLSTASHSALSLWKIACLYTNRRIIAHSRSLN